MFTDDGANMEEHVRKFHGIQQELNARGHYISDCCDENTAELLYYFITSIIDIILTIL
jgi:hypothetical protein